MIETRYYWYGIDEVGNTFWFESLNVEDRDSIDINRNGKGFATQKLARDNLKDKMQSVPSNHIWDNLVLLAVTVAKGDRD